ncbi:monovalent cation:H+ antiporter, CPA1 (nhx1) [Friedmanniomyces endolithicus]|nr:monovalent cation:H+ antiporter, CPA1 (nhx1) [Friedmanniomyces endolithicus]KAK0298798.1 monovalent cation:H+ antiporter, CPA1 (nhx1) [Friedmanniomyces endolithicus]KAK1003983.1 monovalent cation:H+ antiporter, CPA1 (nhx1) [Friedmanniomyces endolithicus]
MGFHNLLLSSTLQLAARQASDSDDPDDAEAGQKEIYSSLALLILIGLLIVAFFTSYLLHAKKIQAVHETVISIFAGMLVGLILRLTAVTSVLDAVSFKYQFFFNLLLPPIILASGYELHQGNFFRNLGTILTFAFAGTFISALVLAVIQWLFTRIPLEGLDINFVDAMSVGATLSATDPVTILAIFNTYKVDPKLYTIIFGESILNDAIAIVLFETAQKYREGASAGIVSLLFCGICLKHYAYHNMSRRTQLTTKFTFSVMAQLSENFIFIYLGLSLFTEPGLEYKPLFILVTVIGICVARWCAVFPLSALVNWFIRYRARRRGQEVAEEIPWNWKVLIFWAGLRGAVGVALAAGLAGPNAFALKATVLVVVVLTVIIFGGTTARMLEILDIRTGVVEEIDSDDEFDTEPVRIGNGNGGSYARRNGKGFGHTPKSSANGGTITLDLVNGRGGRDRGNSSYSSGNANGSPPLVQPDFNRRNSPRQRADALSAAEQGLLDPSEESTLPSDDEDEALDLDLPPAAQRRSPLRHGGGEGGSGSPYPLAGSRSETGMPTQPLSTRAALSQILNVTTEEAGNLFNKLDESFLKPHLLLDPGGSSSGGGSGSRGHGHGGGG